MTKKLLFIALSIHLMGCVSKRSLKVPKHPKIYNYQGYYIPPTKFLTASYNEKRDTSIAHFYSQLFKSFQEPNLSTYQGDSEVYRLTLDRTFTNYACVTIVKSKSKIILTYKETNGIGGYYFDDLSLIQKVNLSQEEWRNLIDLTEQTNYWNTTVDINEAPNSDGESWLLEAKDHERYHCSLRLDPDECEPLYKIGKMMLDLSLTEK